MSSKYKTDEPKASAEDQVAKLAEAIDKATLDDGAADSKEESTNSTASKKEDSVVDDVKANI